MSKILVTGAAGFIGFHLVSRLINDGYKVVGLDNLNEYYDRSLKVDRLVALGLNSEEIEKGFASTANLDFHNIDLSNKDGVLSLFEAAQFDYVVNLAAQAGVRYSIENPYVYESSNVSGFLNILEGCRQTKVKHLLYASSSSVYGLNDEIPFKEEHATEHPISLYAATKKADEMMAHTYSYLYNIPTSGLRFFTVYGPWGRPDMALFKFTKKIIEGDAIDVYNNGEMLRDFTYVDDIVDGVVGLLPFAPKTQQAIKDLKADQSSGPYVIYNIGNGAPVGLMEFVNAIEGKLETKAEINFMPLQPGDVPKTFADTSKLSNATGYKPKTAVKEGVSNFIDWYKDYYQIG